MTDTCTHCGRRTEDVAGDPPLCDQARALAALAAEDDEAVRIGEVFRDAAAELD